MNISMLPTKFPTNLVETRYDILKIAAPFPFSRTLIQSKAKYI